MPCYGVFAGGAHAELHLTWASERRCTQLAVRGSEGELRLSDGALVRVSNGREEPWPVAPDAHDDSWHAAWFPPVLDAFAGALAQPERASENRREAELCQRVIDAAYRSSAQAGVEVAL